MTPADLDAILDALTPGARRALMAMTGEWQRADDIIADDASCLFWSCCPQPAEMQGAPGAMNNSFRLTPHGLALQQRAKERGLPPHTVKEQDNG